MTTAKVIVVTAKAENNQCYLVDKNGSSTIHCVGVRMLVGFT